jgi:hypothetical protein
MFLQLCGLNHAQKEWIGNPYQSNKAYYVLFLETVKNMTVLGFDKKYHKPSLLCLALGLLFSNQKN